MSPQELRDLFRAAHLGEVSDIATVTAGLSGAATYVVTTSTGAYVLKEHDRDQVAFRRATTTQRLAAAAEIAPPLVFVDAEHMASISAKIEGVPLAATLADPGVRPRALEDVVRRLRVLHALDVPTDVAFPDVQSVVLEIWRSQTARPGFPSWALELGERLSETNAMLAADRRVTFGHGDLHPANILWDGARTWLVDWQRSGPTHPYGDLATLSNFLLLPEAAAVDLLAAQEKMPELDERSRGMFRAARLRSRIVYGAAFLQLVPDLTTVPIGDREAVPTLADCYRQMAAGELRIGTPQGQAAIGAALLKG